MFVTTIVVGAVAISQPFTLTRRPYMRDIVFYLAAVYWTFFVIWNNYMDINNSIGDEERERERERERKKERERERKRARKRERKRERGREGR